jgi:hypothetical protein
MKLLFAGILLIGAFAAAPANAAGKVNVIELTYNSPFGKVLQFHFMPEGGFAASACRRSLPAAIAEYGPDFSKALNKNSRGVKIEGFERIKFVEGSCKAFDMPPGQLMKLKISGK